MLFNHYEEERADSDKTPGNETFIETFNMDVDPDNTTGNPAGPTPATGQNKIF